MDLRHKTLIVALLSLIIIGTIPPARAQAFVQTAPCVQATMAALSKQGSAYVWGAKGPATFDCSGLTYWAYQQVGINIGVSTYDQAYSGVAITCTLDHINGSATTCWAPGDLIFLRYSSGQHVAIYAGDGLFIDAYNENTGVIVHDPSQNSFYQAHFWQARRIISGCEHLTVDPGTPTSNPPLNDDDIALEHIAPIVNPVQLQLGWQCGYCETDGVTELTQWDDPVFDILNPGYWFQWLSVQIWNHAAYPIICWMLNIAQAGLNALSVITNTVLITAINSFWRLFVRFVLWLRDIVLTSFALFESVRLMLWQVVGLVQSIPTLLATTRTLFIDLFLFLDELLHIALTFLIAFVQPFLYLLALFFSLIPGLVVAAAHPDVPPQIANLTNNVLFQMFIETFQAIADSKLGWAWIAFIAIMYARFALWLLDESAQLNS